MEVYHRGVVGERFVKYVCAHSHIRQFAGRDFKIRGSHVGYLYYAVSMMLKLKAAAEWERRGLGRSTTRVNRLWLETEASPLGIPLDPPSNMSTTSMHLQKLQSQLGKLFTSAVSSLQALHTTCHGTHVRVRKVSRRAPRR